MRKHIYKETNRTGIGKTLLCALLIISFTLLLGAGTGIFGAKTARAETEPYLVETAADFLQALSNAQNGDTIWVGDIDFPTPTSHAPTGIISKSVTIKSGLTENGDIKKATLNGGSFMINGGAAEIDRIAVSVENIVFVGLNDIAALDFQDDDVFNTIIPFLSYRQRAAFTIERFCSITFSDCEFGGYASGQGAICAIYSSEDKRTHQLTLNINDCVFRENAGIDGGAIYAAGLNNIALNIKDSGFYGNVSGRGGAIFASGIRLNISGTSIRNNRLIHYSGGLLPVGGGIWARGGSLNISSCEIGGNDGNGTGGGLYLDLVDTRIDGCVIAENTANSSGAIYIASWEAYPITVITNTSIYDNISLVGRDLYAELSTTVTPIMLENPPSEIPLMAAFVLCSIQDDGLNFTSDAAMSFFGCFLFAQGADEVLPAAPDYNYIAPSEKATTLENGQGRIVPLNFQDASLTVPTSALKAILVGLFSNSMGTFFTGDNYKPITVIRLNVAGGIAEQDVSFAYGQAALPTPKKTGYSFDGWYNDDGTAFNPNNLLFGGNTEAYEITARWTAKTYSATFMTDDEPVIKAQTFDEAWVFPAEPKKDGYKFLGWYTGENGSGQKINAGELYAIDNDVILYAHWDKIFPSWAIALIVIGGIAVLTACAFCVLLILRRRKLAPITAGIDGASSAPIAVNTESLDALAARYGLTSREKEVALLLVAGKSRTDIASELFLSVATVKTHTHNIYSKLEVKSKFELLAKLNQAEKNLD